MKEPYARSVLTNGLRVVSEHMPAVRSVALGAWVETGSRDETPPLKGVSHFLEHMLFKGTKRRTARHIAEALEDVGGSLNAYTSKEFSCYTAHVLDEHLPLAVDVLADILQNSLLAESDIEKEKEVILREMDHSREMPEDVIFDYLYEDVYPDHPLGHQGYGEEATVKGFARRHLADYLQSHYTKGRIVVAAAGNVSHAQLVELVERGFSNLPENDRPQRQPPVKPPCGHVRQQQCAQVHVCIGGRAYPYADPRKFALLVLDTILGAGMSSRLFQRVREEHGAAYAIYSFVDFFSDTGLLGVYFATEQNKVALCTDLVLAELRTLCKNGIPEDELIRAKSQLKGNLVLALENTSSRMSRLAKLEIYLQSFCSLEETISQIEAVTVQDVHQVAAELLAEDRLILTRLEPKRRKWRPSRTSPELPSLPGE
ncbi:MAG: pitrilysin family protein [bacterium]|nr:insulinase family protein [candidate division KSB1 bacterium]MDH7558631.1 pitrilysin family protein [bacterium]